MVNKDVYTILQSRTLGSDKSTNQSHYPSIWNISRNC